MAHMSTPDAARSAVPARSAYVNRPFAGIPGEQDIVAMRQLLPAATMTATTTSEHGSVPVVLASTLPMLWPAQRRSDGTAAIGLQATVPGHDLSRAFGQALADALAAAPDTRITSLTVTDDSPRLQDLLDLSGDFPLTVEGSFDYWVDAGAASNDEAEALLPDANRNLLSTRAVAAVPHAFWVDAGTKEHLRWVLAEDEEKVIDALARLHARRDSGIGPGTRYAGSFRADGMIVPVWDLPAGHGFEVLEHDLPNFVRKFDEALHTDAELTPLERRARGGIVAKEVTLR